MLRESNCYASITLTGTVDEIAKLRQDISATQNPPKYYPKIAMIKEIRDFCEYDLATSKRLAERLIALLPPIK